MAQELVEETGLQDVPLRTVATYRYNTQDGERIVNQFVRVYVARVPHDVPLRPEADEVTELRWFEPEELKAEIARTPHAFTPGFLHELREYFPRVLRQLYLNC